MMNRLILFVFVIFAVSCSKESADEFATGSDQTGIVGKWKLVERRTDNGGGDIHVADKTAENIIISFDSKGKTTDVRIKCEGEYTFNSKEVDKYLAGNLIISFGCISATELGSTQAVRIDNNHLTIYGECIELCADVYRRLKD